MVPAVFAMSVRLMNLQSGYDLASKMMTSDVSKSRNGSFLEKLGGSSILRHTQLEIEQIADEII